MKIVKMKFKANEGYMLQKRCQFPCRLWDTEGKRSSSNELFSNTRIYLVNLAGIYETFDTEL